MITWNYGEQDDYGCFNRPEREASDRVSLLSAISNAVFQGTFSAADREVVDRMRDLAGIPRTSEAIASTNNRVSSYWREVA